MIGDKIIITAKDKKRSKKLINKIKKLPDKSVICIQAGSGCSKTELMLCLQELLYKNKKRCIGISLDDYYKVHFNDRTRQRQRKGIKSVGLKEIDWEVLKDIVRKFKKGSDVLNVQLINKYSDSYNDNLIYEADKVNYIIVEGLYAGYLKKYKLADYVIHLEGNPKQTLAFRKKRKKEKENTEFRRKVVEKEFRVVSQLKRYANKVIKYEE